ncbi:MAG: DUF1430 domain-containing protein, partial [Acutalibacteraceae bacterium]|nr:DUF1430 domain-containing protein [Acutalibacteraceae bacterium]
MKRILRICFAVLFIYINIIAFLSYSYSVEERLFKDKTPVTISKNSNITNQYFVEELEKIVNKNNSDIMFQTVDMDDEKEPYLIYSTFNNDDFISISAIQKISKTGDNTVYSTMDIDKAESIYCSNLFVNINIYDFREVSKYNLNSCKYYIDTDTIDYVMNDLQKLGYDVEISNEIAIFQNISVIQYCFLPIFLMCVCILFYVLSLSKDDAVKKLNGYSNNDLFIEKSFTLIKELLLFFLVTTVIALVFVFCIFGLTVFDFVLFGIKIYAIILAIMVVFCFVASLTTYFRNLYQDIKGKDSNIEFFSVILVAKFVFFILLVFSISTTCSNLNEIYKLSVQAKNISDKVSSYVTMPLHEIYTTVDEQQASDRYLKLYDETNSNNNGVMIYARNYWLDSDGMCLAETYEQDNITINENYLKINPIYNADDELIINSDFDDSKFNILIPECKVDREEQIKDFLCESLDNLIKDDINVIIYKNDNPINTFNSNVNNSDFGTIKNPIIYLYSHKYLSYKLVSAFSGGEYFVETTSDNPYEELYPVIKENGLEDFIPETPYISSTFSDTISFYKKAIISDVFEMIIYLLGLVVLIYQFCRLYCESFKERISVKMLYGYEFINIHKIYLIASVIIYILFAGAVCVLNSMGLVKANLIVL